MPVNTSNVIVICGGVILLQLAKAADKVSDATQLSSDLNDVKAVTDVEKAEDDPGADAIRGALSIRRFSTVRRASKATNVDPTTSVNLPNWRNRKESSPEWHRESTIREVPAEEERRKSSVQFDPTAPHTHIYPPRRMSPEYSGGDHVDEVEFSRSHNPLSPVAMPDFMSAPPTPRYNVSKRPSAQLQKSFSFGKSGRKKLTEEETIGLVEAGRNEGGMSDENDDKNSETQHSDHTEDSDYERHDVGVLGRGPRKPYDML